jgi:putative transposase
MPNYRRLRQAGGTYFFTQVTYKRIPWLCEEQARLTIRNSINHVMKLYPFTLDAIVLLPDHIHCIWTLPEGDDDYSIRWRLIKTYVSKRYAKLLNIPVQLSESRIKKQETHLGQKRFWEHLIKNEKDYENHCHYIHYNPVKHGLCQSPADWEFSSFHRFVDQGIYSTDWGANSPQIPDNIGKE